MLRAALCSDSLTPLTSLTSLTAEAPRFQDLLEAGFSESFLVVPMPLDSQEASGVQHIQGLAAASMHRGEKPPFSHLGTLHFGHF